MKHSFSIRCFFAGLCLLLLHLNTAQAQGFRFKTRETSVSHSAQYIKNHGFEDTITVYQDKWDEMVASSSWGNNLKFKSVHGFVRMYVDHAYPQKVANPYTLRLTYRVYGYRNPNNTALYEVDDDTLTISYHPDSLASMQDVQYKKYSNYHKLMIVMNGLYLLNGASATPVPVSMTAGSSFNLLNFRVEGAILVQPFHKKVKVNSTYVNVYGPQSPPMILGAGTATNDYLPVHWNLQGASLTAGLELMPARYELEWTWVDNYNVAANGTVTEIPASQLGYDFKHNSTRVLLDTNFYRIPQVYQNGYLLYRVRMVRPDSDYFRAPIHGPWSGPASGMVSSAPHKTQVSAHMEDKLNWQYTVSFAEQGKYKNVMSYYDGMLKNRQSITRFNSEPGRLIATEQIYDFEGRPSISILPTPVPATEFRFQHNMALHVQTGKPYRANDFDLLDLAACPLDPRLDPLRPDSKAAQYYSPANPDQAGLQRFVPDAGGYPMVQTLFSPGFEDRVDKQGGAGDSLQLGSGHTVKNAYVSTEQTDLNRLFGLDIGWSGYYRKTVSRDPNGQFSLNITDYEGRTVSSSMIGIPDTITHAITQNTNVPDTSSAYEDFIAGTPQQVMGSNFILDKLFFNEAAANSSSEYQYSFSPYPTFCPGKYLNVSAGYTYGIYDECGTFIAGDEGQLGTTGVGTSGNVHTEQSTVQKFFMENGKHNLRKTLSIDPDEVDKAVGEFMAMSPAENCLKSKESFIKDAVLSKEFPCPATFVDLDCGSCAGREFQMMQELWPNKDSAYTDRKYGVYRRDPDYVVGNNNSIFTLVCGRGTQPQVWDRVLTPDSISLTPVVGKYMRVPGSFDGMLRFTGFIITEIEETLTCRYRYQDTCIVQLPDEVIKFGISYTNLKTLPVDTFIYIFSDTIARALLPLHPEYCKLLNCKDDFYEKKLMSLPDSKIAEALGMLRLSDMINADPLYARMQTLSASYPSAFDSLATSSNGIFHLDTLALVHAWCNCTDTIMFRQCISHMFREQIDMGSLNEYTKEQYFNYVRALYVANRKRFLFNMDDITTTSPACAKCADARMELVPMPVFINTFNPNNTLSTGSGSFYTSVLNANPTAAADLLLFYEALQDADPDSLASFQALIDSAQEIYNTNNTVLCNAAVDHIITQLINCADPVTLLKVKDTLEYFCSSNQVVGGRYTPQQIRRALTANGVTLDDLCNPFLVNYDDFLNPAQGMGGNGFECMGPAFYTDASATFNTQLMGILAAGGSTVCTLNPANQFEQSIRAALGNPSSCQVSAIHDAVQHLYTLRFSNGSDTVKLCMKTGMQAPCTEPFAPVAGTTVSVTVNCIKTLSSGTYATGYVGKYFFALAVHRSTGPQTATCVLPAWSDKVQMNTEGENAIAGFVPCTQIRDLYGDFEDTLEAYAVKGTGHPYYAIMLRNYLNYRLHKSYSEQQYLDFIQSCALADFGKIRKYSGYYKLRFSPGSYAQNFLAALNSIDPQVNISPSCRFRTAAGEELWLNLSGIPLQKLKIADDFIASYTSGVSFKQVNAIETTANLVGTLWLADAAFVPGAAIFGGAANSFTFTAVAAGTELWNGTSFEPYKQWLVYAPAGNTAAENSYNSHLLQQYMYQQQMGYQLFPFIESTVNDQYNLPLKKDFLNYTYSYQALPPNAVLEQLQTHRIGPALPPLNAKLLSYGHPAAPGNTHNLYIANPAEANDNYYQYRKLSYILGRVSTFLPNNALFFNGSNTRTVVNSSSEQLMAYRCSDRAFWYRYFGPGDTLFNIFVRVPEYLDNGQMAGYAMNGFTLNPGEGPSRSFRVRLTNSSLPGVPLELDGFTDFTVGYSQSLNDVLLTYALNEQAPLPDTVDNCERQRLNAAIAEGMIQHAQYMDSVRNWLRSDFLHYVMNGGIQEKLYVGYNNQRFNYTLYYYDRAGNLMRTVPPAGAAFLANSQLADVDAQRSAGTSSAALLPGHLKASSYQYNSLNMVTSQHTPDGGTTLFFYDAAGRPVFSQSEKQRPDGDLTYTLYDQQGRITETGVARLACAPYFAPYPSANVPDAFPCSYYVSGMKTPFPPQVANLQAYTHAQVAAYVRSFDRKEVVVTQYDEEALNLETYTGMSRQKNLRKRVAAIKYLDFLLPADPAAQHYNYAMHFSYDIAGNVATLTRDFPAWKDIRQQFKRIDYDYDVISGKVNLLSYNRSFADQYYQRYQYDDDNRITSVETSNDGYIWKRDAAYQYYQHGPLARMSLGDLRVQGVDYAYTIQGWLKAINGDLPDSTKDMGRFVPANSTHAHDAVALSLDYFKGDYRPIGSDAVTHTAAPERGMYNGNIPGATTVIRPFPALRSNYIYDQLNRLIKTQYDDINPADGTLSSTADYFSKYTYDADGNIQKLQRNGHAAGGSALLMDDLSYHYDPAQQHNRLLNVTDPVLNPAYHNDIKQYTNTTAVRYLYDATGNLIKDMVGGQDTINWNHYGKVTDTRNETEANKLLFAYDGSGQRYMKTILGINTSDDKEQSDYYVRDATGNILAIYKATSAYKMVRREWIEYITNTFIESATTAVFARNYLHPAFTQNGHFNNALLQEIAQDETISARLLDRQPVSYYVTNSPAMGSNLLARCSDKKSFYPDMAVYSQKNDENLLGAAVYAQLREQPGNTAAFYNLLLGDKVPADRLRQVLDRICSRDTLVSEWLAALELPFDSSSTDENATTVLKRLQEGPEHVRFAAQTLESILTHKVSEIQGQELIRAFTLDHELLAEPRYTDKDEGGVLLPLFQQAMTRFSDAQVLGRFLDGWSEAPKLLQDIASPRDRIALQYAQDPAAFLDDYLGSAGGDIRVIQRSLAAIPGLNPGQLLQLCPGCGINWTTPVIHSVLERVLERSHTALAAHHIYGSSRLGTRDYLPGEYYLSWDNSGPSLIADTSKLINRRPWYSYDYNDAIMGLAQQPWQNTDVSSFYLQHILGRKQYELSNHLGNVQATVSDYPYLSANRDNVIQHRYPALVSAYDYYPFGMLMPGRYVSDNSNKCMTITQTSWVPHWVDSCYYVSDWVWPWIELHGTATATVAKLSESLLRVDLPNANDALSIDYRVSPGVAHTVSLDAAMIEGVNAVLSLTETLEDGSTATLGATYIDKAGIVELTATPATGTMQLKITKLAFPTGLAQVFIRKVCVKKQVLQQENLLVDVCSQSDDRYRFGFNGMEKDNELKGIGNSLDFGARIYDSRIARWLSLDLLASKYPSLSPYNFVANNPILFVDPDGNRIVIREVPGSKEYIEMQTSLRILQAIDRAKYDLMENSEINYNVSYRDLSINDVTLGDGRRVINEGSTIVRYDFGGVKVSSKLRDQNNSVIGAELTRKKYTVSELPDITKNCSPEEIDGLMAERVNTTMDEVRTMGLISITGDVEVRVSISAKGDANQRRRTEIIGHELFGHAYEDTQDPTESGIWKEIEERTPVQGPSHGTNNPSGIQADRAEQQVRDNYDSAVQSLQR